MCAAFGGSSDDKAKKVLFDCRNLVAERLRDRGKCQPVRCNRRFSVSFGGQTCQWGRRNLGISVSFGRSGHGLESC